VLFCIHCMNRVNSRNKHYHGIIIIIIIIIIKAPRDGESVSQSMQPQPTLSVKANEVTFSHCPSSQPFPFLAYITFK